MLTIDELAVVHRSARRVRGESTEIHLTPKQPFKRTIPTPEEPGKDGREDVLLLTG
jgi:hypothetical protein